MKHLKLFEHFLSESAPEIDLNKDFDKFEVLDKNTRTAKIKRPDGIIVDIELEECGDREHVDGPCGDTSLCGDDGKFEYTFSAGYFYDSVDEIRDLEDISYLKK